MRSLQLNLVVLALAAGCAGNGSSNPQQTGGGSGGGGSSGGGSGGASTDAGGGAGGGGAATDGGTGVGGGGGAAGGTSGSAILCGAPGLILCDNFDSDTVGAVPPAPPWLGPDTGCGSPTIVPKVDTAQSKSSPRALVSSAVPYDACSIHADLGASAPTDFWVRAWVRFAAGANQFMFHEVSAFELAPSADVDDPEIRVGFRGDSSCQPTGVEVNISGGAGGEQTGCTGVTLNADQWYCFELHVTQTGGTGAQTVTADLTLDHQNQSYVNHGVPIDIVAATAIPAPMRYLKVGARSYSSAYPYPIYVDDIAVGPQQLGCP
jgi:hypothetical protein